MVLQTAVNNKQVKKEKNSKTIQSIKAKFIGHSFHAVFQRTPWAGS